MGNTDYLFVLQAVKELPFNVGKKLLIDFLRGDETNKSVMNNNLYQLDNFGALAYENEELDALVEELLGQRFLEYDFVEGKKFWRVINITRKGQEEIENPSMYKNKKELKEIKFSEKEENLIRNLGPYLSQYNEGQKKAIISDSKNILCIAGAGSGKTTVLTKRIEFLIKYKSISPEKILAITFTRKARTQMKQRLANTGINKVHVETFNSFCEKILRKNEKEIYEKPTRVLTYKDKMIAMNKALTKLELTMEQAIDTYFSDSQIRNKSKEQLASTFMNDCFFVRDYLKSKNEEIEDVKHDNKIISKDSYNLVFSVTKYLEAYMAKNGLRDFMDQLLDCLRFLKENKEKIPGYEHILVDEFQDVNSLQVELLNILKKTSFFCVGDPRQSIFGWRGSDIRFINDFEEHYKNSETIMLTTNYRSDQKIVRIMNRSIEKMMLPDLKSEISGENKTALVGFENEITEYEFIAQSILASESPREEIFVLARMNKQLNDISALLTLKEIPHVLKNDDAGADIQEHKGKIVLATVHSIKGLEAETVYVTGCTSLYFPCKGSEHPFLEMIKLEEYDKEEEERRLFYVAISRAKKNLILTYTGKYPTYFITTSMKEELNYEKPSKTNELKVHFKTQGGVVDRLKEWRRKKAEEEGIKPFMIMHDTTLYEIADRKPLTVQDLSQIKGIAATKLQKYGEELLDQIF